MIGADLFFAIYLLLTMVKSRHITAQELRRHPHEDDEGILFILALAMVGVVASLWSVASLLGAGPATAGVARVVLAVASVPLGWATIHTVRAFHYARMHYLTGKGPGLDFPGLDEHAGAADHSGLIDFIYFSFTIGMTAQTADVRICRQAIRRAVTPHAALSFFYNTVILALTVNAAVSLDS
ncbi:MAG: DUF1345 domain-containing protein [Paracoccus sp. (in: a-proteobacteria)]|nr:DUF1345 domain-containing protein [Paracoccus sp. (in: a-proteobacteria)]